MVLFAPTLTAALAHLERDQVRVRTRAAWMRLGGGEAASRPSSSEQRSQMRRWKKQGLSVCEIVKKVNQSSGSQSATAGAGLHSPEASRARRRSPEVEKFGCVSQEMTAKRSSYGIGIGG